MHVKYKLCCVNRDNQLHSRHNSTRAVHTDSNPCHSVHGSALVAVERIRLVVRPVAVGRRWAVVHIAVVVDNSQVAVVAGSSRAVVVDSQVVADSLVPHSTAVDRTAARSSRAADRSLYTCVSTRNWNEQMSDKKVIML